MNDSDLRYDAASLGSRELAAATARMHERDVSRASPTPVTHI